MRRPRFLERAGFSLWRGPHPAERLRRLLEAEAACLRDGRIRELAPLAEDREAALAALGDAPAPTRAQAETLRRLAERNARLLTAVGTGLRAATDRLQAIEAAATGQATYGRDGARAASAPRPRPRHERKV